MPERLAEVHRLLERYLVEVVEAYGLCPWARSARLGGELAVEVLWGAPPIPAWIAAAEGLLARPATRVAMVIAPELDAAPSELREIRTAVAERLSFAGVAEFHPGAPRDLEDPSRPDPLVRGLATPARLVPYLRRSPDPLLQLVPLSLLDGLRGASPVIDLVEQAQILQGAELPHVDEDIGDRIAANNHARVGADVAALAALLDDIAEDRRRSYARVGINAFPTPR